MSKKGQPTGFSFMDPTRRQEVASYGGRRSHALGKAYRFNSETARAAALKLGQMRREQMAQAKHPYPPEY